MLLIDELDRTDEAFEAFLLEVLADFQVTIPEIGTVKAEHPPIVVITSNRTREIHDALKRRCLYHWVDYPDAERELAIVRAKVPGVGKKLSEQVVAFVQALRKQDLFKPPGVAETLDWAAALSELDAVALDPATVSDTLGVLLKYQDDIARLEGSKVKELLDEVQVGAARRGVSAMSKARAPSALNPVGGSCKQLAVHPVERGAISHHDSPRAHLDCGAGFQRRQRPRNGLDGEAEVVGNVLPRHR